MRLNHSVIERSSLLLLLLTFLMISVGGLVQIVPLFRIETTVVPVPGMRPYTPLEQLGRNIYTREGCYTCHSQQIRPFRDEVDRYGPPSLAGESAFDRPFLWGSKRTGPDLARVGGKYSNEWHTAHLLYPRSVLPHSIMPSYAFLRSRDLRFDDISAHLRTLQTLGVPYSDAMVATAAADIRAQAGASEDSAAFRARYAGGALGDLDGQPGRITEMDALIAYLQSLGTLTDFTRVPATAPRADRREGAR